MNHHSHHHPSPCHLLSHSWSGNSGTVMLVVAFEIHSQDKDIVQIYMLLSIWTLGGPWMNVHSFRRSNRLLSSFELSWQIWRRVCGRRRNPWAVTVTKVPAARGRVGQSSKHIKVTAPVSITSPPTLSSYDSRDVCLEMKSIVFMRMNEWRLAVGLLHQSQGSIVEWRMRGDVVQKVVDVSNYIFIHLIPQRSIPAISGIPSFNF